MLFPRLGIYGWKEADENLALSSLLTGDPVLPVKRGRGAHRAGPRPLHRKRRHGRGAGRGFPGGEARPVIA